MKAPFWGTREFRLLLVILTLAGSALLVIVFEILPAMSRKLPKSSAGAAVASPVDGFFPSESESKLPKDEKLKAALDGVKDSTPISQMDGAYAALIEYLSNVSPDVLASEARSIGYSFYFESPQTIRGHAVSVTAMFLDWKPIALEQKIGGVEFVYRVYLLDPSATEGYVADILEQPPSGLEQKSLVTVDGLFLKTGTYEANKAHADAPRGLEERREVPLVLGRRLQVLKHEYQPIPFDMKTLTGGVAVLSLALLVLTIWAYRHGHRKREAARRPRPSLPPGSFPGAWPRPAEKPLQPAFAARREPRAKRAPPRRRVSEDIFSVSGRQRRMLLAGVGVCGVVLLGMLGWILYQRFGGTKTAELDFSAACASLLESAESARKDIAQVEQKVWTGQKTLEKEDYELVRAKLPTLEKKAETLLNLIEAVRGRDVVSANPEVARVVPRLVEVQLWVLDAARVLEHSSDPAALPGFYIPLHEAMQKWRDAQKELAAFDAEKAQAARQKVIGLKAVLEEARASLAKLTAYVQQGLALDNLAAEKVADLDTLIEESHRANDEITRVEKLLAPPGN